MSEDDEPGLTTADSSPDPPEGSERIINEWRGALDALADVVLLVDGMGRILRTNRTAETWGLGAVKDLPGKGVHDVLHPSCEEPDCYLAETWSRLRTPPAARAGEEPSTVGVAEVELDDWRLGRRVRLSARQIGQARRAGSVWAVLVLRDVTVHHHRRVIRERRRHLEAMEYLVRGLAHEIGNPLAAVKTSVQVLIRNFDRFPPEKKQTYLRRVDEEADRIQSILDRVLRDQSWKPGPPAGVPVGSLVLALRELYRDEMAQRHLRFEVSPPADDLELKGDAEAVETVLAILLDNAMDATEPGGHVMVSACGDDRRVRIKVEDSGCGLSPGDLERIFQPFFSTKPRGTGLGITHASHLMEQMSGRLEIDSTLSQGTTATLVFPAAGRVSTRSTHGRDDP